jgi:hypothetical protein
VLLTRKRITCETYLDMPVGLTLRQEPGTGTPVISELHFGDPCPGPAGPQDGWLVALGITNPGCAPVRGSDFSAPLTFTFPGREVHATRISPGPAGTAASRARPLPIMTSSWTTDIPGRAAPGGRRSSTAGPGWAAVW